MILVGNVLVLTYDDVVEGLLSGTVLTLPQGAKRLTLTQEAINILNADLGLVDVDEHRKAT
jgi:hypothetical protein